MYGVPVSVICAGEHVVCVASIQYERSALKLKIRRDQRRKECIQIAGYLRMCLGGKVGMNSVSDAY